MKNASIIKERRYTTGTKRKRGIEMKPQTLEEWADFYEQKTGEKLDRSLKPTFFFPDKGFAVYKVTKDMIIISQVCGDGHFWKRIGEVLALERGLCQLGTIYIRNNHIKAYLRNFGMVITGTEMLEYGKERYYFKDKFTNKPGRATPAADGSNYLVTWEV